MPRSKTRPLADRLVDQGLAPDRLQARTLIARGLITVAGAICRDATRSVPEEASLARLEPGFASRGGRKLEGALDALGITVAGLDALDVGASTGGFTDCLLRRGARRVCALDVGHGLLAWSLRQDPRVSVLERCNARTLTPGMLPFPPAFITVDVSFISLALILPPLAAAAAPGQAGCLALVKPQFESEPAESPGGVVADPAVAERVLRNLAAACPGWGWEVRGAAVSPLPGDRGGNIEFFLLLGHNPETGNAIDFSALVQSAWRELKGTQPRGRSV